MIVTVCSTNYSVGMSLYTIAAKNGFTAKQLKSYDFSAIKGSDYCILDLDNLKDFFDDIKRDAPNLSEVVIIGISRNAEILDLFRPILFDVVQKQFLEQHFKSYVNDVVQNSGAKYVINKDEERVYDKCGVKLSELLETSVLSSEDYLDRLRDKITESKISIKSENEFFEDIKINTLPVPEPVIMSPVVVYEDPFVDNALMMYRTRKLKSLNLSAVQIEEKLRVLTEQSASENKKPTGSSSAELLSKLKSGYFRNKPKPKVTPAIPSIQETSKIEPKIEKEPEITTAVKKEDFTDIDKKYSLDYKEPEGVQEKKTVTVDKPTQKVEPITLKPESKVDEVKKTVQVPPVVKPEQPVKIVEQKIIQPKPEPKDEPVQTLDVSLSPEKEALLGERLARLQALRKQKAQPKPQPKIEEPIKVPEPEKNEEPEDIVIIPEPPKKESPDDKYDMDKAIHRLRGSQPLLSDKEPIDSVKRNSEKGLPTKSLFEELKERADAIPVEDKETLREKRKKEVDKKSKPPRR